MLGTPMYPGLTALLAEELYSTLMEDCIGVEIICSYLEIYNENVHDLLSDIHPPKALQLLEDGSSVVVSDLSWFRPSNAEELMSILRTGNLRRSQLPTDTNKESSRSHAIFQARFSFQMHTCLLNLWDVKVAVSLKRRFGTFCSKLCLVDLAGSDRASSHTDMRRRVEGANINKSLLALGSCIDALADGLQHVPFRNSKLTRLLKNSLDGNCRTIMIANVSPSSLAYDDTFSTLKYAARVKYIKNSVKKNLVSARNASVSARDLEAAKVEIALLQMEIESLRVENRDLKTTVKEHVCVAPEFRDRLRSCSPVNEPDDDDDLPFTTRNEIYSDPGCRSSLQSSGSVFEEPGMSLEKPRPRSESSYEIPRIREPLSRRSTEIMEIDSPKSTFREHADVMPEFRDYSQSWLAEPKQQRSGIVPIMPVQERQVFRETSPHPNPNTERRQS
ncbi:kinesin-like protein KIF18B [Cloeon dipterum]|uniref:kinesin-like protein KIF18B n=1 Tax=Cloeon dipterum TaxID=197152 RepID=UPI00321FA1AD